MGVLRQWVLGAICAMNALVGGGQGVAVWAFAMNCVFLSEWS